MKKFIHLPSFFVFIGISVLVGVALNYFTGLSFWYGIAIGAGALLLNGIVATVEDQSPGGFNNPKARQDE